MAIFRDEPVLGIETLTREASRSETSIAAKLRNAAKYAVRWCGQTYQHECERALADKAP